MFGSDFDTDALTTVRYDVADGVATVTLDRPDQHNVFTAAMADELSVSGATSAARTTCAVWC